MEYSRITYVTRAFRLNHTSNLPMKRLKVVVASLFLPLSLGIGACGNATTVQVSSDGTARAASLAELQQVLRNSRGLKRVLLAPGDYGTLNLRGIRFPSKVVIEGADPRRAPTFRGLVLRDVGNLAIRNVAVKPTGKADPASRYGALLMGSDDIELDGVAFVGPGPGIDRSYLAGVMLRSGKNIVVSRSYFKNFRHGLELLNVENTRIVLNEFEKLQTDAIRGGGVNRLLIANNVMTGFSPRPKDHPDGIQLWSTNQKKPGTDIEIRGNLVARGNGAPTQGVFIRDTKLKMPFERLKIADNLIIGGLWNGISVSGAHGVTITNNCVVSRSDQKSWIRLGHSRQMQVTRNIAVQYLYNGKNNASLAKKNRKGHSYDGPASPIIAEWLRVTPGFEDYRGPVLRRLLEGS